MIIAIDGPAGSGKGTIASLVSKKLNVPLVYDSHEIFTEMPAVNGRFTQKIWRKLERNLVPKIPIKNTPKISPVRR